MQFVLIIALSLHILAAVFWAGTSFVLARSAGVGGEQLFRPQMSAAVVAVLAGAYLWIRLHAGAFGRFEQVLAVGAACAILAAAIQGAVSGRALRALRQGKADLAVTQSRIAVGQRIASGLLAATIICMAAARYV